MTSTITLWQQLQSRDDRACKGQPTRQWTEAQPGTLQAHTNEELCRQCPALQLCAQLAEQIHDWQKQGTLAGTTWAAPSGTPPRECTQCGTWFNGRKERTVCSLACAGRRRYEHNRTENAAA